MTAVTPARAIAIDLVRSDNNAKFGAAILVPSDRRASVRIAGADLPVDRQLTPSQWQEIARWIAESDAALPAEPAPLAQDIAAALAGEPAAVIARRTASFQFERS